MKIIHNSVPDKNSREEDIELWKIGGVIGGVVLGLAVLLIIFSLLALSC